MTHRNRRHRVAAGLVMVLAIGLASPALGGGTPPLPDRERGPKDDNALHAELDASLARDGAFVEVMIHPATGSDPEATLRAHGASDVVHLGDVILARLPAASLSAVARSAQVRWIEPAPIPHLDAVTGQGPAVTGANTWQAAGVDGTGVVVAVIDGGFSGYTTRQTFGDLPPSVDTLNLCPSFTGDPHGTAVAEIVHEMAPGAELILICVNSPLDLADAVDYAIAMGASVITESLTWHPAGKGDGSGWFAPIVQEAHDAGLVWVNSAGNAALNHWSGIPPDADVNGWYEFSGGDETNSFSLDPGRSVTIYLRWNDWPTSSEDVDLFLFRESEPEPVAVSEGPQTGIQPPTEELEWTNSTAVTQTFHIALLDFSTTTSHDMDFFIVTNQVGFDLEYSVASRSVTDPGTSPLIIAAGAAYWGDGIIEDFSSRGPTIDGALKPEIAGPDGVSSASYGSFFGTSASAPHVAAAAALVIDASPCLDPEAVEALLADLAVDAGVVGDDNTYGAGLLHLGNPATVADTTGCVLRRSGPNRYATAAVISEGQFPGGADTVFIATGLGFPDGLAGAAVAARLGAPLLLTSLSDLPPETATELNRLDPDTIVVLGGPGVVSDSLLADLAPYAPTVTRVFGANRYETAVAISQYGFPTPPAGTVFVATGLNFPDALAAGAAAAKLDGTVLLVPGTSLPASVAAEIVRLDPATIVVVGGTSAVSDAVLAAIDALQGDDTVIRISGSDRYVTATNISDYAFGGGAAGAFVATGLNFPDALAGAAAAGAAGWPVLLIPGTVIPAVVTGEIDRLGAASLVVLGGNSVVTAAAERALEDGLG